MNWQILVALDFQNASQSAKPDLSNICQYAKHNNKNESHQTLKYDLQPNSQIKKKYIYTRISRSIILYIRKQNWHEI